MSVITEPIRPGQPTAKELAEFKMPKIEVGEQVVWYEKAIKVPNPNVAYVNKVGNRMIDITLLAGVGYDEVRHIDDPKIKLGGMHVREGAWDYTPQRKRELAERQALEERFAKIEKRLDAAGA